jgi:hypothetical protein
VGAWKSFGAAVAAAVVVLCAVAARAGTEAPAGNPSFLWFAGTDLWRDGAFLNGGLLWSPAGLDGGGFTLKLLLVGGRYTYPSSALGLSVDGTMLSAAAMPGWRLTRDGFTIGLYAGPVVQDFRLTPFDPGSRLHGSYAGGQLAADVWYQPDPARMVSFNGSIGSAGLIGSLRGAVGWRLFEPFFVGP